MPTGYDFQEAVPLGVHQINFNDKIRKIIPKLLSVKLLSSIPDMFSAIFIQWLFCILRNLLGLSVCFLERRSRSIMGHGSLSDFFLNQTYC